MMWALKIGVKLVLSRLPVSYAFWKSFGLFRHGQMDSIEYAIKIFRLHVGRAYPQGLPPGSVVLELGPGDSISSALLMTNLGARHTYLVDVGRYAETNVEYYRALATSLRLRGIDVPDLAAANDIEDVLRLCGSEYLTSGLQSLKAIPDNSVDFVWSHSVLEHVRKHEIEAVLHELRRIMKPGGMASHNIDFQDHLERSLNNLRFSDRVWESSVFAGSGFYTNRIPAIRLHRMFEETGFEILQQDFGRWPELPLARKYVHSDFNMYSDDDLLSRTSHVLLRA